MEENRTRSPGETSLALGGVSKSPTIRRDRENSNPRLRGDESLELIQRSNKFISESDGHLAPSLKGRGRSYSSGALNKHQTKLEILGTQSKYPLVTRKPTYKRSPLQFPSEWPYNDRDFIRQDNTPDKSFYEMPRFVRNLDVSATEVMHNYYTTLVKPGQVIFDFMASYTSHIPPDIKDVQVIGLGMNAMELTVNKSLKQWMIKDINADPTLPFEDNTFDLILITSAINYITHPLEVFQELHRVLKDGCLMVVSFSNRSFPTKAIKRWLRIDEEQERCQMVANYFYFAGGFESIESIVLKELVEREDPLYVVQAKKGDKNLVGRTEPEAQVIIEDEPKPQKETSQRAVMKEDRSKSSSVARDGNQPHLHCHCCYHPPSIFKYLFPVWS